MKREDQKRNKELQKTLSEIQKECVKAYSKEKIKKKDYLLWLKRNGMIFTIFPHAYIREADLKAVLKIKIWYKPLWADDLLWDVLGMETNKQEPDSLRAIGAFTAVSATYQDCVIELQAEDLESVKSALFEKVDEFLGEVNKLDDSRYINDILGSDSVSDIDKALVYIHLGELGKAEALVNSTEDKGRYIISGKSHKELMAEYLGEAK